MYRNCTLQFVCLRHTKKVKIIFVTSRFVYNCYNCKHFFLLASGSTPLGCYKKLIEYYKNGEISFHYVKTFNMDEYVGKSSQFFLYT